MPNTPQSLAEAARNLSPAEQDEPIDLLLDPVDPAVWVDAWAAEAAKRLDDVRAGTAGLTDADDVIAEGRRRLAARRG